MTVHLLSDGGANFKILSFLLIKLIILIQSGKTPVYQMHNTTEFIPERFDPVRFYGTITYTRSETHGEIYEMTHNTSDSLEEETYATCFTDPPFHFSSIILTTILSLSAFKHFENARWRN